MARLLDLFCSAGGSAMGYYRAGFTDILGVDHVFQKHYPFPFHQADALEVLERVGPDSGWDLIHASPPCQAWSAATPAGRRAEHPNLVAPVRERLQSLGVPYVIENVPGAPLENPIVLCGLMFGLRVFRHRLFESSRLILAPPHGAHRGVRIGVDGWCTVAGGGNSGLRDRRGGRYVRRRPEDGVDGWKRAMGIDWMTRDELAQAVPPAYTEYVGGLLRQRLG